MLHVKRNPSEGRLSHRSSVIELFYLQCKTMDVKPYLKRIRSEFPDLRFKRAVVPKQGMDHLALFLDHQWVFRFAKNPEYIDQFPKEIELLDALHKEISLPIPHYEFVSSDKSFGGYKKIHGRSLTHSGFQKLSKQTRDSLAAELGNFLNELHAFSVPQALALGVKVEDPTLYLKTLKKEYEKYVRPKMADEDRRYCNSLLALSEEYAQGKYPERMTHNDMFGVHIRLTKQNHIAGIIDFGDKVIGDPAKDFNGLLDIDPSFVKAVYAHYDTKDDTLLDRSVLLRKRGSLSWLAYNAKAGTPRSYARAFRHFKRVMNWRLED